MSSNEIALIFYGLSIVAIVMAGIITISFVIPLQLKEAGVKNGLSTLRKQMLAKGFLHILIVIVAFLTLTMRHIIADLDVARVMISMLVLFFSLGLLGKSFIDSRIYRQQYTPESKRFHEEIARKEDEGSLTKDK